MKHQKRTKKTAAVTLDEAQRMVDHLSPVDQARLLTYLAPRVAGHVSATHAPDYAEAWDAFLRIGETLEKGDTGESETLTAAVLSMRR